MISNFIEKPTNADKHGVCGLIGFLSLCYALICVHGHEFPVRVGFDVVGVEIHLRPVTVKLFSQVGTDAGVGGGAAFSCRCQRLTGLPVNGCGDYGYFRDIFC